MKGILCVEINAGQMIEDVRLAVSDAVPVKHFGRMGGIVPNPQEVLDALEKDHDYLTAGGVFPEELLKNFISSKRAECSELSKIPHPAEFEKYYNL